MGCKATLCGGEKKLDLMFKKGRAKVNKDMNIIEMIRNQKILIAAVNEIMTTDKFGKIAVKYFKGGISSSEETVKPKVLRSRTLDEMLEIRKEYKPTTLRES